MVEREGWDDSKNCAGGNLFTGRISLDRQVKGDDPGLPVWMFGVEIAARPIKPTEY